MAANNNPIFPLTMNVSWGKVLVANTATDGNGAQITVFTAGTNGSRIDQIKVRALGTNVATVLRFFLTGYGQGSSLVHEVTIAATTASQTTALVDNDITIVKNTGEVAVPIPYLPAGYSLSVTVGTTIASGLQVTVHGANY